MRGTTMSGIDDALLTWLPQQRWYGGKGTAVRSIATELMGLVRFPKVGELPYLLSLPGHGFMWFGLQPGDLP